MEVVSISRNSADLKWTAPERDGGSPITNYVVEKRDVRRKGWQAVDTTVKELKHTVSPLNDGSLYVFRVAAENAVGVGPFCEMQDSVLAKDTFSKSQRNDAHMWIDYFKIKWSRKFVCVSLDEILLCCSDSRTTLRTRCQRCDQEIRGLAMGGTSKRWWQTHPQVTFLKSST